MTSDGTSGPAKPAWSVRQEQPRDERHVQQVVESAFDGPHVPALLTDMRQDHCWLGLSFVAERPDGSGDVLGHVAYTRGWIDAPDRLVEVLVLSPLAVQPQFQHQGVGRQLVHRSLEMLASRPEPLVFLEGDPGYYRRLGFEPAADLGVQRPSYRIPQDAFQAWRLRAFGSDLTGALVYPDVFWRHDAVGLRP